MPTESQPKTMEDFIGKGHQYLQEGKLDQAEESFAKALTLAKNLIDLVMIKIELSRVYSLSNWIDRAHKELTEARVIASPLKDPSVIQKIDAITESLGEAPAVEATPLVEEVKVEWVSLLMLSLIAVLIVAIIVVGVLIIRKASEKPVPKTVAERDLISARKKVKEEPDRIEPRLDLALVYVRLDQIDKAKEEVRKALQIEPRSAEALYVMGLVYKVGDETDKAIKEFSEVVKLSPRDYRAYFELGLIYSDKNNDSKAIEMFKKGLEIEPTAADIHYKLGQLYEKTKDKEAAIAEYQEALKYVPEYKEAKVALNRLQKRWKANETAHIINIHYVSFSPCSELDDLALSCPSEAPRSG